MVPSVDPNELNVSNDVGKEILRGIMGQHMKVVPREWKWIKKCIRNLYLQAM